MIRFIIAFAFAFFWVWGNIYLLPYNAPHAAEFIIKDDPGGVVIAYLEKYRYLQKSNVKIKIDGKCYSACTLVLILDKNVCATNRASFGFHSAWVKKDGQYFQSAVGNELLMHLYPPIVRDWISFQGGLSTKWLVTRATAFVPPCS